MGLSGSCSTPVLWVSALSLPILPLLGWIIGGLGVGDCSLGLEQPHMWQDTERTRRGCTRCWHCPRLCSIFPSSSSLLHLHSLSVSIPPQSSSSFPPSPCILHLCLSSVSFLPASPFPFHLHPPPISLPFPPPSHPGTCWITAQTELNGGLTTSVLLVSSRMGLFIPRPATFIPKPHQHTSEAAAAEQQQLGRVPHRPSCLSPG